MAETLTPVGEITEAYSAQIDRLVAYAAAQAAGMNAGATASVTVWDVQKDAGGADINPSAAGAPALLADAPFSRDKINLLYEKAVIESGAVVGDLIGMTHQGDYLAMIERAYRFRHTGRIRRHAHACARLAGHGDAAAGVFARVRRCAQDAIFAGSVGRVDDSLSGDIEDVREAAARENAEMGRA